MAAKENAQPVAEEAAAVPRQLPRARQRQVVQRFWPEFYTGN
jgi:hypothetical protein